MNPENVTIRSSPTRLLLMQIVALAGVAGGLFLVFGESTAYWIVVGVVASFAAIMVILGLVMRVPAIDIDSEGVTARVATGSRKYLWKEIDGDIEVLDRGLLKLAAFKLTEDGKARLGKITPPAKGYDAGIGGFYELPMAKLVEMLNEWKRKAGKASA